MESTQDYMAWYIHAGENFAAHTKRWAELQVSGIIPPLPEQYRTVADLSKSVDTSDEDLMIGTQKLGRAVLLLAMQDATMPLPMKCPRSLRKLRDEARAWFTVGGEDFRTICALTTSHSDWRGTRQHFLDQIAACDAKE